MQNTEKYQRASPPHHSQAGNWMPQCDYAYVSWHIRINISLQVGFIFHNLFLIDLDVSFVPVSNSKGNLEWSFHGSWQFSREKIRSADSSAPC